MTTRKELDVLKEEHDLYLKYERLREKGITVGKGRRLSKAEKKMLRKMHPSVYDPIYSTDWKDDMSKSECRRLEFLRDYCKKECMTRKCQGCEFIAYHKSMEQKYNGPQVSNETSIQPSTQGKDSEV